MNTSPNLRTSPDNGSRRLTLRFVAGIIFILLVTLGIFYYLMSPPMAELGLMARFLSVTALVSLAASYAAYRLGWMHYSPTLRWTLLGGYALSSLLTFLNVWYTARLMFASPHDLMLALVLLLFAGGIAMALGYFLSSTLTDRIRQLDQAARRIAQGELQARIPAQGRDEMAGLALTFNQMAARLQEVDQQQRELETLRRDLIAWVGHDLQTPLTSIRAILEALADGMVEDPETQQRYLRTAQREVGALSELIDDLFEMARLDAGGFPLERSENSLSDLVSDTLESFSELAQRSGVELRGTVEPGLETVWMDAARVGRVLDNLVGNALRHTPRGGQVTVAAARQGSLAQVQIRDTGEGIRPEDLPHIFERFYRGEKSRNRQTGGAGLGLAIARGIVEAHGGTIEAASQPGQGTSFTFTLPLRPGG